MLQKNLILFILIIFAQTILSMQEPLKLLGTPQATREQTIQVFTEIMQIEAAKKQKRNNLTPEEIEKQTVFHKLQNDEEQRLADEHRGMPWQKYHNLLWENKEKNLREKQKNILRTIDAGNSSPQLWKDIEIIQSYLDLNNEQLDHRKNIVRQLEEQEQEQKSLHAAITLQAFARKNAAQKIMTNMREAKIQADVAALAKKREDAKRRKVLTEEIGALTVATINRIWPIIDDKENKARQDKKLAEIEIKKQQEKIKNAAKKAAKNVTQYSEALSPTSITVTSTTTTEPIEATIEISTELQQSEYNNYIKWVSEREQKKEKLKATLTKQYHQNNRDKRYNKDERNKTIELNFNKKFQNNHPEEEAINRVFQQYENTLNTQNTSIEQIIYIEKCFQKAEELLLPGGRSIKWYFANRPDLEVRIKDRIKTIQKMTLETEQKSYRIMRNCMIPQLQNNNDDTLYQLQQTSLLLKKQQEIIYKIQSFHTHNGYLDTSKLKNPGFSNLDNKGIISLETLHKTEQDITAHLLSATETSMRSIAPIITHVLQQANIDTSPFLIKSIMDSASMIAIHPDRGDSSDILDSDRFMNEIQASLFRTLYQQNRLVSEPETEDQMADKVKIHVSVIKAYIKSVQTKS